MRGRICMAWLALSALVGSLPAQTPYEDFNLRAKVLADFDRDQDGELSALELRNAAIRAEAIKFSVLEDLARGLLNAQPWDHNEPSIWDPEANSRLIANYAGRWMSAHESLPTIGPDGLVDDPSRMRELTPWESFEGNELLPPLAGPTLPAVPSSPFAAPWWLNTTATSGPLAPGVMPMGTGPTPSNPGLPGTSTPNSLARPRAATPGSLLPPPGAASAAAPSVKPPQPMAPGTIPGPVGTMATTPTVSVYRADATFTAKANSQAGVPRFQLGTTKVLSIEPPRGAATSAAAAPAERAQRPQVVGKAGALGPMRIVPPSPSRAGILTTRPIGKGARP